MECALFERLDGGIMSRNLGDNSAKAARFWETISCESNEGLSGFGRRDAFECHGRKLESGMAWARAHRM